MSNRLKLQLWRVLHLHHDVLAKPQVKRRGVQQLRLKRLDHPLLFDEALDFFVVEDHANSIVPQHPRTPRTNSQMDEIFCCTVPKAEVPMLVAPVLDLIDVGTFDKKVDRAFTFLE